MIITADWDNAAFHDARVLELQVDPSSVRIALEGVFLLPGHVSNSSGKPEELRRSTLIFEMPAGLVCRAYDSETKNWQNLAVPYPSISSVAEVTIRDKQWTVTGFEREGGRWLELQVTAPRSVSLIV
jgi:hypothetical protein